jgi:peroxiredoxin
MTAVKGQRVPPVRLGRLRMGEIESVSLERLVAGRKALVLGVPGAFPPVCTSQHIPELVATSDKLRASGIDRIFCLATNDPWTLQHWAAQLDPDGKIEFLSDGNLEFGRAMGLTIREPDYFLGERTSRFLMVTEDAVIRHLVVEPNSLALTCTRPGELLI